MRDTYYWERKLKAKIERLEDALYGLAPELRQCFRDDWGIKAGDLAVFCTEFSIKFRAIGEQFRCVPYHNILATVDDAAILADFYRTRPPAPLVRLYGT